MSDRIAKEDYVDDAIAAIPPGGGAVDSVNTQTGVVVLDAGDVGAQPVDSDLTALAALTTTIYGRALLELANAAAGRTAFGLGTAAVAASGDFQPNDGDLTAIAALTTTAYGRSLLEAANAAALRTLGGLVIGTDVQAQGAYAPGGTDVAVADGGTGSSTAADARTALGLIIGTDVAVPVSVGRTNLGGTIGYQFPGTSIGATLSTMALAINTIEYAFLLLPTAMTIDQCGFVVTTAPASNANVRIGIYAASTDWQPSGNPLFDVAVAVASGFTGIKAAVGTVVLPAGRYLTAINCDVAMTVRVWRGFLVAGGFVDSTMGSAQSGGTVASTYGAMPAPGTAYATARSSGDHHVALRVSVP